MQYDMKANGKYEDQSTLCQFTPEEHMSQDMHKEQDAFLTSVAVCWGPKITIKDLGPDILNLITDPMNDDPWENEDGTLFPKLDNELAPSEESGD